MFTEQHVEQLLTAIKFSAEKHRNQRRKDADASPYINHPIQVAEVLFRVGEVRDMIVLIGAILHDTIEDTETSPAEIASLFGDEVLHVVLEVTDDKRLPKHERKRLQIEQTPNKSEAAKLIKLGDKICNVGDVMHAPPQDWTIARRREYLDWTEKVIDGVRGTNAALEKMFDDLVVQGRNTLLETKRVK
jgi:guanosine-3',5'-bis(diphosphate) 3'-pyrophosphohydrolase